MQPPALQVTAEDVLYVMYTSGSTGRPKGVVVTNGPLLKRIGWMRRAFPVGEGDSVPFKTQYVFGVSEWELFHTLTAGATLIVCDDAILRKPAALAPLVAPCAVLFLVPSHLNMLLSSLKSVPVADLQLRHVVCCGEALLSSTADALLAEVAARGQGLQLHNVYGPTEASMTHHVCLGSGAEVTIGGPIDNTTVRLASVSHANESHSPDTPSPASCGRCGCSTIRCGLRRSARRPRSSSAGRLQLGTSRSRS